jgi:hypothetical protein
MMYATLLAQAAIIASLALFAGPVSTIGSAADSANRPSIATAGVAAAHDKTRLRCRIYFGCAPSASSAIDSPQE